MNPGHPDHCQQSRENYERAIKDGTWKPTKLPWCPELPWKRSEHAEKIGAKT
jgi:hypothetical protein